MKLSSKFAWVLGAVLLAAGGLVAISLLRDRAPSRPELAAPKPKESGTFVGTQTCAACHSDKFDSYSETGHARTFLLSRDSEVARKLDGRVYEDSLRKLSYHYHFDPEQGLFVTLPSVFGDRPFPLTYALGSNQNAVTFVSLIEGFGPDPVGIEHRVSVYGDEGRLDLTPGQKTHVPEQQVELFGKIIEGETLTTCIACHTTTATIAGTELKDVEPNVGCESCHGPGSRHVAAMQEGLTEETFIGFGSLASVGALKQIEMCGKCHRVPDMLHPEDVAADNPLITRFQPVGLLNSPCFLNSENRLGCTTCHDPHQHAAENPQRYVQSCLRCHEPRDAHSASCPISPTADCVRCHMPPTEVHPGIFFHDHWIRVHEDLREVSGEDRPAAESSGRH